MTFKITEKPGETSITIVWDPSAITPEEYAKLVVAIGDVVRAHGGIGITRLSSKLTETGNTTLCADVYSPTTKEQLYWKRMARRTKLFALIFCPALVIATVAWIASSLAEHKRIMRSFDQAPVTSGAR